MNVNGIAVDKTADNKDEPVIDKNEYNTKYHRFIDSLSNLKSNEPLVYKITPQSSKAVHDAFSALRSFAYGGGREVFGEVGIDQVLTNEFTMTCLVRNPKNNELKFQKLIIKAEGSLPFDTADDCVPIQTQTLVDIKYELKQLSRPWWKRLLGVA